MDSAGVFRRPRTVFDGDLFFEALLLPDWRQTALDVIRAEMDAFADMITQGAAPLADQNDGLEAQRLAEAASRSFREMRPVAP